MKTSSEQKYQHVGYHVLSEKPYCIAFAFALFKSEGKLYRSSLSSDGLITEFTDIEMGYEYMTVENGKFYQVGEKNICAFIYKEKTYEGAKEELMVHLREILSTEDNGFSDLDKYDIGFFLKDANLVKTSIDNYVKSKENIHNLTSENFVML